MLALFPLKPAFNRACKCTFPMQFSTLYCYAVLLSLHHSAFEKFSIACVYIVYAYVFYVRMSIFARDLK